MLQLQLAIRTLSTTASSHALIPPTHLQAILDGANLAETSLENGAEDRHSKLSHKEQELGWLLVSKATAQTYGLIMNALLLQTIPLSRDIWYWDEVLGSYASTVLYSVQTSPQRLWKWSKEIYEDAWHRLQAITSTSDEQPTETRSISSYWTQFYGMVKDSVRERSLKAMQARAISPLTRHRAQVRKKQNRLKRFREMNACGLGVLMNEGLSFDVADDGSMTSKSGSEDDKDDWEIVISKSVALMETVIRSTTDLKLGTSEFEEAVFTSVENDPDIRLQMSGNQPLSLSSAMIATRLLDILHVHLPNQTYDSRLLVQRYGRPSRMVRYWLPAIGLFLSSSTLLRVFVNRKAEIITWIRDFGATSIDFWYNWVVEPVKKVIGTIRHDEGSQIAIMSKDSLEGDRASLERMVVDFACDNVTTSTGTPPNEVQLADIRAKVREGDLTPVLRAYEMDLRKPFIGIVRGDLVRALLIQIQKTKVDVEVAIGGIDTLLKSQELVFGFVGLTPGLLVCLGVSRWLSGAFQGRNRGTKGKKQGQVIRILR